MIPQPPALANSAVQDFLSSGRRFGRERGRLYCLAMAAGRMLTVGLTGGIGTGKSRVTMLLRELGAAVECSDEFVRELQAPGGAALADIQESFGDQMLLPSGELDRERLGELVFGDPTARKRLNDIIHPRVFAELMARIRHHQERGEPLVVLDIPLLLEGRESGRGSGASDAHHHDGADVWSAIREMDDVEVPEAVQAKLLGGNARRMYGIEPKTFVSEELPITRPDWFPKEAEVEEFARIQKDPKLAGDFLAKMMAAQRQPGMESSSATGSGY